VERTDLVWDKYESDSLKSTTRINRGQGGRRRVEPGVKLPVDWNSFLRVDDNKTKLFKYLAEQTIAIQDKGKEVLSTSDCSVLTNSRENTARISPCSHEEADTRLLLRAFDAEKEGYRKVMLRTVDTDVVVLAVAFFSRLDLEELWVAFGAGTAFRYIAIHEIAASLGQENCEAFLFLQAFTGCDQTSAFSGRGKSTAWNTWVAYQEATDVFRSLSKTPTVDEASNAMPTTQRFVVLM